jgi:hypothetical protein
LVGWAQLSHNPLLLLLLLTSKPLCRNPVDVGSLLRFKSHVVHVSYHPAPAAAAAAATPAAAESGHPAAAAAAADKQQQQQQQQQRVAHVAVEVEAVVSQPEHKETTHTNTFR